MNAFQALAIGLLVFVIVIEWVRVFRYRLSWAGPALRTLIWLAACAFIYSPDTLTHLARTLGISRGADLLLYGLTLAFLFMSFLLYARIVQLRRQMTQLVRHLAMNRPQAPAERSEAGE